MASKRNSRVFDDDMPQQDRGHSSAMASIDASRRTSRTSSIEDMHSALANNTDGALDDGCTKANSHFIGAVDESMDMNMRGGNSTMIAESIHSTTSSSTLSSGLSSIVAEEGRMANFGVVAPGIYRSSYPLAEHFPFCRSLGLRTVITLVNKDDDRSVNLGAFVQKHGIRHVVFNMKGTKKEDIPHHTMQAILEIVHDTACQPLLIHCNQGKHRTGCVVAAARKVAGWPVETVLHEYRAFAEPKVRDCDIAYITALKAASIHKSKRLSTSPFAEAGLPSYRAFRRQVFIRLFALSFGAMVVLFCSSWQWNGS